MLVVCIDASENLLKGKLHKSLSKLGFISVIRNHHHHKTATPTHTQGSTVIDRIYVSPGFTITAADYTSFNDAPGDH